MLAVVYRVRWASREAKGLSKPKEWPDAAKRVQVDWPGLFDNGSTEFPWESGWSHAGRFYPYDLGAVIAWRRAQSKRAQAYLSEAIELREFFGMMIDENSDSAHEALMKEHNDRIADALEDDPSGSSISQAELEKTEPNRSEVYEWILLNVAGQNASHCLKAVSNRIEGNPSVLSMFSRGVGEEDLTVLQAGDELFALGLLKLDQRLFPLVVEQAEKDRAIQGFRARCTAEPAIK